MWACVYRVVCDAGGGDNGYGSGIITSLKTFDRERLKEYHIPVIIRDSGSPPISGTNTLTVVIGDVNDNKHRPAHKHVLAYTYPGIVIYLLTYLFT